MDPGVEEYDYEDHGFPGTGHQTFSSNPDYEDYDEIGMHYLCFFYHAALDTHMHQNHRLVLLKGEIRSPAHSQFIIVTSSSSNQDMTTRTTRILNNIIKSK